MADKKGVLHGKGRKDRGARRMFKRFDTDQIWVALILGLVVLLLAVYRMRVL